MKCDTARCSKVRQFGIECGGADLDRRFGFQDQARLLGGLFAPAHDHDAAARHLQEHWKCLHADCSFGWCRWSQRLRAIWSA